jgi:enterochelin esterase-like enzyme
MSSGVFCALNTGLRHLDLYGTLLASLPSDDLGDSESLLGGNRDLIRANTPRDYIATMQFTQPVSVMSTAAGNALDEVDVAKRIAGGLKVRGQHVALRVQPGMDHTWQCARAALRYLLAFAARYM